MKNKKARSRRLSSALTLALLIVVVGCVLTAKAIPLVG